MTKFTMFGIGANIYAGVHKIMEESAELGVVLAKLITVQGGEYWDGRDLPEEIIEELGDLMAAIDYFKKHNPEIGDLADLRRAEKLALFNKWHEDNFPQ